MVRVRVAFPHGMSKAEQDHVIELERQRGAELRASGRLLRTWRVPGRKESLNLWRVRNPTELHDILAALPVYPYCELVEIEALAEHPIDPQSHELPA